MYWVPHCVEAVSKPLLGIGPGFAEVLKLANSYDIRQWDRILQIEDPCSPAIAGFDRKEVFHF